MARRWQQRRNGLGAGHELGTKRAAETLWLQEFRVGIAATWRPAKTPAGARCASLERGSTGIGGGQASIEHEGNHRLILVRANGDGNWSEGQK